MCPLKMPRLWAPLSTTPGFHSLPYLGLLFPLPSISPPSPFAAFAIRLQVAAKQTELGLLRKSVLGLAFEEVWQRWFWGDTRTHTNVQIHKYTEICTHTDKFTKVYTAHTMLHTDTRTNVYTHSDKYTQMCTYTQIYIHTETNTLMYTQIHRSTYTHNYIQDTAVFPTD